MRKLIRGPSRVAFTCYVLGHDRGIFSTFRCFRHLPSVLPSRELLKNLLTSRALLLIVPLVLSLSVLNLRNAAGAVLNQLSHAPWTFANHREVVMPEIDSLQNGIRELKPGEAVERKIVQGEEHRYGISLASGQYARVSIRGRGIELAAAVTKPGGQRFSDPDVPVVVPGPLNVSIIADQPGVFNLILRPRDELAITGSYKITLEETRSSVPGDDDNRLAAERSLAQAMSEKSPAEAVRKFEQSLQLWRKVGDSLGEAHALRGIANVYRTGGALKTPEENLQKADENFKLALTLMRENNWPLLEAYTLLDLGTTNRELATPAKSLPYYNQALQKFREINDRSGESASIYSIGFAHARQDSYQEALRFYQEALTIQQEGKDRHAEANTLNAMGGAYQVLGENMQQALDYYEQAEEIFQELKDPYSQAFVISNKGVVYDDWGDWQKARESYQEALLVYKSLLKKGWAICVEGPSGNDARICRSAASALNNIGELYNSLGNPQLALDTFNESLPVWEKMQRQREIGTTLSRMCYSNYLQENYKEASSLCERAQLKPISPRVRTYTLIYIGMINFALNEPQTAVASYQRALELQKGIGERRLQSLLLDKMGGVYVSSGDMKNGLESYHKALQLWREVKDQDGEAMTLHNIARAEQKRGNFDEARRQIARAIEIIESLRVNVGSLRLRSSYFATKINFYELDIDLKMQQALTSGSDELVAAALEVNERARARSLIDTIVEAQVQPGQTKDSSISKLVEVKVAIEQKLNDKKTLLTGLLSRQEKDKEKAAALSKRADDIAREINALTVEYDETQARIKALNPSYASLVKPRILSAKEIQERLLDNDTLLLEYSLGSERSYLWVVSRAKIKGYELTKRAEIEEAARSLKGILADSAKREGETAQKYHTRLSELDAQFREKAAALTRMLLEPAASALGKKRLLIVADGELQYIPFGALYSPATLPAAGEALGHASSSTALSPLLADHEIVNLPSATTLAVIRDDARLLRNPSAKTVAVFADPVFEVEDSRVHTAKRAEKAMEKREVSTRLRSQMRDLLDFRLTRLPATRDEAMEIMAVVPRGTGMEALGFKANRRTATDPKLAQYRIVHFATHGLLNDQYPELSGIVLSLYDEQGRLQEDGFLRLHDIYNLKLPVELVVLSACRTALGKNVRGEGLIGLTRGFMYAGAERVVASLWKVEDEATAELMKRFYNYMLKGQLSPAAALRAAQLSMREQSRWSAPYFWAGFVLQGEWK